MAILGRSGAGKTNVAYLLVWSLLKAGKPFIILDWRGTYKHFMNRPEGRSILHFSLGEEKSLSFNPLQPPPNLDRNRSEAYVRDIISTVCTTYLPGHHLLSTRGAEYLFLKALDILSMFPDKPATFNDIQEYVTKCSADSRERDWRLSALNVLFKLTKGPIGRLMNSNGFPALPDIIDRPVILELTSLGSETDRALFSQAFLLWLFYFRLSERKQDTFKHAVIVEEAHNLFLRRPANHQSVHDHALRQFRELGQSLILLDQNPSLMSIPSLGNTGVTICLNLKHADDVEAAGKALTLPRESWDYIGRLPIGHAIVKLQDRWMTPFLARFPLFPIINDKKPTPAEKGHSTGDSLKRKVEELQLTLDEAVRALPKTDRKEKTEERIAPQESELLVDIARQPLAVVTERYERLGWSAHSGTKIKRRLLEKGLVEQEKVSVPKGSVTLLKVSKKGREVLRSKGMEVKALPKNASLEHEYWKHIVAEKYRQKGYKVEEEVPIGDGKAVDLVAKKDGKRIAIEVETGKSDAEGNVKKCEQAGFNKVVSVHTKKRK